MGCDWSKVTVGLDNVDACMRHYEETQWPACEDTVVWVYTASTDTGKRDNFTILD